MRIVTEVLHNPVIFIPLIVLGVQLVIKIIVNVQDHDWYGLYLAVSGLGVDLSLLVLVIYLGVAITNSHRIVQKILPRAGSENEAIFAHLIVLFIIVALLSVSLWFARRAEHVGKERFSISWKEPAVKRLFIARIASAMLLAVQEEKGYHRSAGSCVPGAVWTVCSTIAGMFLTAFFVRLVVG